MPEKIQKPWAVYGVPFSLWLGKIIDSSGHSLHIRYSEGQHFPLQLWDPKYVKRFSTSLGAIDYLLKHDSNWNRDKFIEKFLIDFPSEKPSLQKLLLSYQNPISAQRRTKCTKKLGYLEKVVDCGEPDGYDSV